MQYIIDDFELFLLTVLVHVGVETFAQSAGSALVPVRKKELSNYKSYWDWRIKQSLNSQLFFGI
jgi:hypothetical protein